MIVVDGPRWAKPPTHPRVHFFFYSAGAGNLLRLSPTGCFCRAGLCTQVVVVGPSMTLSTLWRLLCVPKGLAVIPTNTAVFPIDFIVKDDSSFMASDSRINSGMYLCMLCFKRVLLDVEIGSRSYIGHTWFYRSHFGKFQARNHSDKYSFTYRKNENVSNSCKIQYVLCIHLFPQSTWPSSISLLFFTSNINAATSLWNILH